MPHQIQILGALPLTLSLDRRSWGDCIIVARRGPVDAEIPRIDWSACPVLTGTDALPGLARRILERAGLRVFSARVDALAVALCARVRAPIRPGTGTATPTGGLSPRTRGPRSSRP